MSNAESGADLVRDRAMCLHRHHRIARIGIAVADEVRVEVVDQLVQRHGADSARKAVFEHEQRTGMAFRQDAVEVLGVAQDGQIGVHSLQCSNSPLRRFEVRHARGQRPLAHVDAAIEARPIRENHAVRAQRSLDGRRRRQLDSFGRDDRAFQLPVHHDPRTADVGAQLRLLADRQESVAHGHLSVHATLNDDVLGAGDLAGDGDRGADGRHVGPQDTPGRRVVAEVLRSRLMANERELLVVDGREIAISNPRKVLFPAAGYTKLDVVRYYLAVAGGALRGAGGRPNVLVRYPNGIGDEFFYQKRAPQSRPDWIEVVALQFPSGRTAEEIVPRDAAALAWMANLACLELHPHPVRAEDLDHPDELRVDLDPLPGVEWSQVQAVARVVHAVLDDLGLIGWPKTSGSRGIHVNVRIAPRWPFVDVRRAAVALAREVERRAPAIATSKWWKEERHGVFIDYNQNAKDRTVASAYSVRPRPDARVSAPLTWDEIDACDPADFTLATMPARFAAIGDRHADIDSQAGSLEPLLELAARDERDGLGDAPWPPQYKKQPGEAPRVQPSRARARGGRLPSDPPGTPGRRVPKRPLIEVARARRKEEALEQLAAWKARYPDAARHLQPADILVDAMRGRSSTWTRVRVNLQHVPEEQRPGQEALEKSAEELSGWIGPPRKPSRARTRA